MTRNYSRTSPISFDELTEIQQAEVVSIYGFEKSDCHQTNYVLLDGEALPLNMFMRTNKGNNFTHGIYSIGFFAGYFITFSKDCQSCVIAYKYF